MHRLLREDPKLAGQRVRKLIEPLGYAGSKTVVDDYLRDVRTLVAPAPRTFQRMVYRPGEICQFHYSREPATSAVHRPLGVARLYGRWSNER